MERKRDKLHERFRHIYLAELSDIEWLIECKREEIAQLEKRKAQLERFLSKTDEGDNEI